MPRVVTGSGRVHCYFRPARPMAKFVLPVENGNVEFRTGNHIAVVPPSVHPGDRSVL
ncbi:MAG: bifunctional DNA primase/polymerase [Gammaproteobacteria bacterium]|nr:bifunctional DNA primase/polymerase [Gammaproteobacteria bacterium]